MAEASVPGWEKWKKMEPHRLARYIDPAHIARCFRTAPEEPGTLARVGGATRFELAAQVYEHLQRFDLRYDATPIDFADHRSGEQIVRSARQVRDDGGSCLDLSLVYAGLCQHVGLRPVLVILRDHTLVAVALASDIADAKPRSGLVPGEEELLQQGLLAPRPGGRARLLAQLDRLQPDAGAYVVVECTGLSTTDRLGGAATALSFAAAVTAGHEQLAKGDLRQLVDPTFFHLQAGKGITPYPVRESARPADPIAAVLGPAGVSRLTEMLEFAGVSVPARWTAPELRRLAPLVADLPSPAEPLVADAVGDFTDALVTAEFMLGWMPHVLTTEAMRRALRPPGDPPATPPGTLHTLADYLEYIALHHRGGRAGLRRWLASFVVQLAVDAGMELDVAPVHGWARKLDILVDLNDFARRIRAERENARARLIVSLHAAVAGDWPEQVVAWWLLDGVPSEPRIQHCAPTRAGLEAAIREHVDWADEQTLDQQLELEHVEVAVPTGLLLRWQPEEADVDGRLVQHYDVVTRWSDRLWRNTRAVRKRLRAITGTGEGPVHWLDRTATAEVDQVVALLRDTLPAKAVGLRYHPERQEPLLRALLDQSPILLWPDREIDADDALLAELHGCWPDVPRSLTEAYRNRHDAALARPLAGLRAVWDDEDWLRFCRLFAAPRAT